MSLSDEEKDKLFMAQSYWEHRCGIVENLVEDMFDILRAMCPAGTPASDALTDLWNRYGASQTNLMKAYEEKAEEAKKSKIVLPGEF